MRRLFSVLLVGGCAADGPPAWPGEELPECATTRTGYVIDALTLPRDTDAADATALDLGGDREPDNQFGLALVAAKTGLDWDFQPRVDAALAADELLLGLTIDRCAQPEYETIELYRGRAIDRTASPPRLEAVSETTRAAVRAPGRDDHTAVQGEAKFPLTALLSAPDAAWIDSVPLIVRVDRDDDDGVSGVFAMAFEIDPLRAVLLPAIAAEMNARLVGCPEACTDPSSERLIDAFPDETGDGVVTVEELADNALFDAILKPDVDVFADHDGVQTYWPDRDHIDDSLSFALPFHATRVELVE